MSSDNGARAPRPRRPRCSSCAQRRRRIREGRASSGATELVELLDRNGRAHWRAIGSDRALCLDELLDARQ